MSIAGVTTGSYASMAAAGTSLASLSATSFGWSYWIKPTNGLGPGTTANQFFLGVALARTGSTTANLATLSNGGANSRWELVSDNPNVNNFPFANNAASIIAPGQWGHIASWIELTPGSATRVAKTWVNGVLLAAVSLDPDAAADPLNAWNTLYFGAHPTSGGSGPFAGKVAECCLLSQEPADDEAEALALLMHAPTLALPDKVAFYNPARDTADLTAPLIGSGSLTLNGSAAMDDADHPPIVRSLATLTTHFGSFAVLNPR